MTSLIDLYFDATGVICLSVQYMADEAD